MEDGTAAPKPKRRRAAPRTGGWKKRNYKQWFDEGMKCVKAIDRHATKSSPSLSVPTLKSITDLKACMRRAYRKMNREKEAHAAVRSSTLKMDKAKRQLEEALMPTPPDHEEPKPMGETEPEVTLALQDKKPDTNALGHPSSPILGGG